MMRCIGLNVVLTFLGSLRILQNHSFLIATPYNLVDYESTA